MREPNKKICVICGRAFQCPPSDKTVTCSPACRSERARRANMARGGASIFHTPEAKARQKESRKRWREENPEQATLHQKKATDAAMQLPEGQRGPQNRSAKIWRLITPEGEEIEVISLTDWARRNYQLFEPASDNPEASAMRIRAGFAALSRAIAGTAPIKQRGLTQYKGWGLAAPASPKGEMKKEDERMNIYQLCLSEAANYTDRDAYVSDLALSSIWGDDEGADIPQQRLDWLGQLWDACNRSVPDIAAAANMSRRKLAERFGIPYRTVENWCTDSSSARSCPVYVRLMMQECLGLLSHTF